MSLETFSKFYYGFEFDEDTQYIDFSEGGPQLTAEVTLGAYSPQQLAVEITTAMNAVGSFVYSCSFDNSDRTFTITGSAVFSLLVNSGTSGAKAFPAFGFSGADRTGLLTYTGASSGSVYEPQFILQDHISTDNYQRLVMPSVNKSADGTVEVIRFGTEKFLQANIKFITNKVSDGKVIKYNPTGVDDALDFLQWLILKKPVNYIEDEIYPSTYQTMILDSTPDSKDGTGYKLKELYDKNLPGFFETGILVFRLLE